MIGVYLRNAHIHYLLKRRLKTSVGEIRTPGVACVRCKLQPLIDIDRFFSVNIKITGSTHLPRYTPPGKKTNLTTTCRPVRQGPALATGIDGNPGWTEKDPDGFNS